MCYWYSSEGGVSLRGFGPGSNRFQNSTENRANDDLSNPDFTLQTKLTLRRHQGSRSQINWHGSMNPLVSEMLDAFKILDPSDDAVKGLNPKFTGVGQ